MTDKYTYAPIKLDPSMNLNIGAEPYTFYTPPPIAGYWVFPGSTKGFETKFSVTDKPNWLHRKTMALLLGFRWEDMT
jgi:hypothetical protein